uniref:uncharacterized protein LOC120344437 n=1 Tax=Styela clava TaxID=7725 RepID=UPI00193AD014|nr:uncharacterized protein LOC120344437 [Styela clava]
MTITYRFLDETDFEKVSQFYVNEFFPREPIGFALKGVSKDAELYADIEIRPKLSQKNSVGAFNESGELVGMNIMDFELNGNQSFKENEELPLYYRQFFKLEEALIDGNLEDCIGTKNYANCHILGIRSDYAGLGIATELCKKIEVTDKECQAVYAVATSYYSQKIMKKFGFKFIKTIAYKDYVDPITGCKIYSNMQSPHECVALAVKYLN